MSVAALLLAAALLTAPGRHRVRARAGAAVRVPASANPTPAPDDPITVASALDVFAVCLTAGMAVSTAAGAAAASAPPALARLLRRAADLLALGGDPAAAWAPDEAAGAVGQALLRLARRSAASGAALAHGVEDLAVQCRHDAADAAKAAAERAGVLIAGPLGLCFLPAFVCLGIVPVVAGLAGDVLGPALS
ncbi:type II secretion system F family protein [Mycobacterium sp. MYCO198283]|uniref:type II secretion system F family protein n=1 Tax=Mycobacterium sp. MYCO198283 TaxID=2883505 RepID=UPI001E4BC4A3|nr:type II secretion system F family protein [Mycobacterium sp. MYCO198283]MCG5432799.1 type II secretion system F family protein [Mycobacterium sp. MYCO198283]